MPSAPLSRRGFLGIGASFALGVVMGSRLGLPKALAPGPPRRLSGDAESLIAGAFAGLDRARIWDSHVHIFGLGSQGTGCWLSPKIRSVWHPWDSFRFDVYQAASGITDLDRADQQYVERLLELTLLANPDGKLVIFGFDLAVLEDGSEDRENSDLYVPNDYVLALARQYPQFVPCVSIHPYRQSAVAELERLASAGARAVKWLPSAQGMDPASERCQAFYQRLSELKLPLITHAGPAHALTSRWPEFGNPLRLRRPLDAGVRVVVSDGTNPEEVEDLDQPGRIPAFDAFMRLFTDRRHAKNLFADLSTLTHISNEYHPIRELLMHRDLHHRLLYGSNYPLPAVDPLISTRLLSRAGFLSPDDRAPLNDIYLANPLLFDLILKRRLRFTDGSTQYSFSASAFHTDWLFEGKDPTPD